jgi:LmbE family N-acetylglucosaminyl deacetylase
MVTRVAAVFAHPDDEVLGCGGALVNHAQRGDKVHILILATGKAARSDIPRSEIELLRDEGGRAAEILGAEDIRFLDFPDNALDSVPLLSVIKEVENFLKEFQPDVVYTHHGGDLNVDHAIVQRAVVTAHRPLPGRGSHAILACEVNSSTEWSTAPLPPFVPTEFLDISQSLETKIRALECYESEIRDFPHPRSVTAIRTLSQWRGSQAGLAAAEAFVTLRRVTTDGG